LKFTLTFTLTSVKVNAPLVMRLGCCEWCPSLGALPTNYPDPGEKCSATASLVARLIRHLLV